MTYDVAYRHAQALDPSGLTRLTTTLHAIERAFDDCRRVGCDPESDPAVRLLACHLGALARVGPADAAVLRRARTEAIVAIRRSPVLPLLAQRGVAYDDAAKRLFHVEGRRALKRLADALGLASGAFAIRSNVAGPALSGEVILRTDAIWVELSLSLTRGRELLFRRVFGPISQVGIRNHWASVDELMAPDRLAARIAAALDLASTPPPAAEPAQRLLVA